MSAWLTHQRRAFALAFKNLLRAPLASLLTILIIGIALSLPTGLYLLLDNLAALAGNIQGEPEISLFLNGNTDSGKIRQLESRLKQQPGIRQFRFIPRDQALRDLSGKSGLGDVAAGLEKNPLPDAYVVRASDTDPAALEQLRLSLKKWPEVTEAKLDSAWAKRLHALLGLGRTAVLILACMLGFALIAISMNTIHLQILTQRDEIEISQLIGATRAFIRRPFLYFGALQGFAGGITAWIIVTISLYLLNSNVREIGALYASNFDLHNLGASDTLSLLVFSAWLGWAGAYFAASRHLRRNTPGIHENKS